MNKRAFGILFAILAYSAAPCRADTGAPLPADGRLAYVQKIDEGCVAGLWDTKTRKSLVQSPVAECPEQTSLTAHGRVLVLAGTAYVQTYELESGKAGAPIALPKDMPMDRLDKDSLLAGYTPDGVLALEAEWGTAAPRYTIIKHLYLRKGDAWVMAEEVQCHSDNDPCPFKQMFEAKALDVVFGQAVGQIWNEALAGDPYVVGRIPANVTTDHLLQAGPDDESDNPETVDYDGLNNAIVFKAYGRYSKLVFGAQAGEDTDGTYTFGMKLVTPDDRTTLITNNQFDAAIVGHYLLFRGFFEDGIRVYDLGNGEVVLDNLESAGWLD